MESQSCAITYPFASHPIRKGSFNIMKVDYHRQNDNQIICSKLMLAKAARMQSLF